MIGIPVARVLGVEVRVQIGWILVVGLITALAVAQIENVAPEVRTVERWILGALIAGGFFASAVVHDLSHALVARRRGTDAPAIVVSFFGGTTPLDPPATDASSDLAIAVAGPATSVVVGVILGSVAFALGAVAGVGPGGETLRLVALVCGVVAILNLVLGGLNLVPAYPLDGGRIVRAIAWRRTRSERRGWLAAAQSGRMSGAAAAAAGLVVLLLGDAPNGLMIALSGWFLTLSARSIGDRVRVEDLVGELRVEDVMERDPATVHPGLTIDTFASQLLLGESTITAVPVVDGDELVGMLGVRQVRAIREDKWSETRVEDVMVQRSAVPSVRPRDRLLVATESLQRSNLDGVPVLDEGRLVGVFTRRSLGVAVAARQAEAVAGDGRPDGGVS